MKHTRNGIVFYTVPVVEYIDLPEDIKKELKFYFQQTDHRAILNDSYIRYPYLSDLDLEVELDRWFIENIGDRVIDYVIIHFDW